MKLYFTSLLFFVAVACFAQVPKTLSFQGYLSDKTSGDPLNGNFDLKFSLYDAASGGSELWFDDYSAVPVTKGLYSVILGDKKPITLGFDITYYLQVKVGLEILSPRITVTASAYSLSGVNASTITSGVLNGSLVGTGVNASNITTGSIATSLLDSDLQDLADGSLSGTKLDVIAGSNIILDVQGTSLRISTGGSALSGSGATGQVAFWNGPGSFSSDANMVWDNTNKRLGLGVAPTQKLDVSGTVNATAFTGGGSGLTSLNANNVSSGTIADARLEAIVDLGSLNVGTSAQFVVNSTGNLSKINNVSYIFPASQGGVNSFLANTGTGQLGWATALAGSQVGTGINAANITAGTLPVAQVPGLDATKIITGSFDTGFISDNAITSLKINDGSILNADINAGAAIVDSKLATINTPGKVSGGAITSGTIGGTTAINISGNMATTGTLSAGSTSQFAVDATGNITKLRNITTSFPSVQGAANSFLTNDGSGGLNWTNTLGVANGGTGTTTLTGVVLGNGLSSLTSLSSSGGSQYFRRNSTNLAYEFAALSIVDGDVNASAAISGSKINPDFGSQSIVTTGVATTNDYNYGSAKNRYLIVNQSAFTSAGTNGTVLPHRSIDGATLLTYILRTQGGTLGNAAYFNAPIALPDGAVVNGLSATIIDGDAANNVTIRLARSQWNSIATIAVLASVSSSGSAGQSTINASAFSSTVDNSNNSYFLVFQTTEANLNLGLYNVRIAYTVSKPD